MSGTNDIATCAEGAKPIAFKRGRCLPHCLLLMVSLLGAAILSQGWKTGLPAAQPRSHSQWAHLYGGLPLSFEENRGQTDPRVDFLSHGRGYALFLTGREAVLTLRNALPAEPALSALRLQLLNSPRQAAATGLDPLPGRANYFLGNNPAKWHTNVPTYAKVKYTGVYPGIDLVYYGAQGGQLEYDFIVAPGANPAAIALGISTPHSAPVQVNAEGDLVVALPNGNVQLHKPVVYQETESEARSPKSGINRPSTIGNRQFIEGRYVLQAQNQVRFELGPYDRSRPLVIDPVLMYATYIGGSGGDAGYAISVDTNFDATIAGQTNSTNFPTLGPEQTANKGNGDCFITKMNSVGTKLIYSTFLGGSGSDGCYALAVSSQESAFVTGYTTSTDFPIVAPANGTSTPEPFQMTYGGNTDAFVTELSSTGDSLTYSSYLGGSSLDIGQGIAVDASGEAYVVGTTQSKDFPVVSPLQAANNGANDIFITKVSTSGAQLLYSTYLGGAQIDVAQAVLLDSSDNIYVTGYTFSTDFPTVSPAQATNAGAPDAFVAKLTLTGSGSSLTSALAFSTYLGGSGDDRAFALALDSSQNVYVAGESTSTNFPTTVNSFQPSLKGASDAFVAKLNSAGSSIIYATYVGGSGVDQANGIALDGGGNAYITGFTESADFPTKNPIQSVLGLNNNQYCQSAPTPVPCADAFVTEVTADGTGVTYSTYLGGNGYDSGQGIALGTNNDAYITGTSASTNFPVTSAPVALSTYQTYVAPYNSVLGGQTGNAFIADIDPGSGPNISISPTTLNFGNEPIAVASAVQQVQIFNPSAAPLVISAILVTPITVTTQGTSPNVFIESDNCVGTINPGSFCTMNVTFTPNGLGPISDTIQITDNASGTANTQQTVNVSGSGVTASTAVTVQPSSLSFNSTAVGSQSPPQSVTITNTGTQTLNITKISTAGSSDFSETDNCGALQDTLAVGQSCVVNVVFNPASSGNRSGSLQISDNAVGSPQSVLLTGIGAAEFTLTTPVSCSGGSATNPVIIGSTQATFCILPTGPSTFTNAITLSCSTGVTCKFATNPVFVGTSTVLTISQLTSSLANPYAFQVTGTSGTQSTSVQENLEFEDFVMTISPASRVVTAGNVATYSIFLNPLFGFNQQVNLYVTGQPNESTPSFQPNGNPTLNGSSSTKVTLNLATTKYIPTTTQTGPRFPGGRLPPIILGLLSLAALASLAFGNKRRNRYGWLGAHWLALRAVALSLILVLDLAMVVACRPNVLINAGTQVGNYTLTVNGLLVSNTSVIRTQTTSLSITATPTCTTNCGTAQ